MTDPLEPVGAKLFGSAKNSRNSPDSAESGCQNRPFHNHSASFQSAHQNFCEKSVTTALTMPPGKIYIAAIGAAPLIAGSAPVLATATGLGCPTCLSGDLVCLGGYGRASGDAAL
jgi:hypothetical protein